MRSPASGIGENKNRGEQVGLLDVHVLGAHVQLGPGIPELVQVCDRPADGVEQIRLVPVDHLQGKRDAEGRGPLADAAEHLLAWRVEVAHGRLGRSRRLAKSFENTTTSATGWLQVACIATTLRHLGQHRTRPSSPLQAA